MYARNLTEDVIKDRIVREVDTERLPDHRVHPGRTGQKELNLSAIVGKSVEAKERRLVPEVIEDFFVQAAPIAGVTPRAVRQQSHVYRVGRVPRLLLPYRRTARTPVREARPRVHADRCSTRDPHHGSDPGMGHAGASAVRGCGPWCTTRCRAISCAGRFSTTCTENPPGSMPSRRTSETGGGISCTSASSSSRPRRMGP